jgi:hypothetical protein
MKSKTLIICVACQKKASHRARQLCWRCYDNPTLRAEAEYFERDGTKGFGTDPSSTKTPWHATQAAPGTLSKIEVMAARAERGEALFHPDDFVFFPLRDEAPALLEKVIPQEEGEIDVEVA